MKKFAQHLTVMAISAGVGLASLNVCAVPAAQNTTLIFNSQDIATFSNSISAGLTDFNDLFTFTTTSSSGGASSIASFNGRNFSAAFSSFTLHNVDNSGSVVATGTIDPGFFTQPGFSGLNSNTTYGLNIIGTVTNPVQGAFYSGSIAVNPIPEPAEYILMACGLGVLGLVAYRRRHQQNFSAAY